MTAILLRTAFMYFFVFLIMRLMGKREIGKLSVFDLVISIMIAEIAVIVIESEEKSLWVAVSPIILLVLIQIVFAFVMMRSRKLRIWFDGKPSVLIRDGSLNKAEMRKQRYNLDDLMVQLRESQVADIDEVELAVLESTGKLSVIVKEQSGTDQNQDQQKPQASGQADATGRRNNAKSSGRSGSAVDATVFEDNPKLRFELLPLPLIMDGSVQDENLDKIGKTRFWLKQELKAYEVNHFRDVFFCTVDHKGKLFVDKN